MHVYCITQLRAGTRGSRMYQAVPKHRCERNRQLTVLHKRPGQIEGKIGLLLNCVRACTSTAMHCAPGPTSETSGEKICRSYPSHVGTTAHAVPRAAALNGAQHASMTENRELRALLERPPNGGCGCRSVLDLWETNGLSRRSAGVRLPFTIFRQHAKQLFPQVMLTAKANLKLLKQYSKCL